MSEPDLGEEIDTQSVLNTTTLVKPYLVVHPDVFLPKQPRAIVADNREMVEVTRAYTLPGKPKVIYCRKQQQLG